MERWVLEGDSYSFLRSAPHTFNLQSHERPNRVEIFDITSIPSHHNAISETTCLCDIFGDEGESPSLSSSPSSATFIRREVDQSIVVDDTNDSLGSYHTANGSDLSDNAEVTYNTPSPENTPDFSTPETRESCSPPTKSPILSDSKNGLNQLHCTPSASKVNSNDLSHTDNWEESQVSVITAPVNETAITNASEPQYVNSTPATTLINPAKKPSNPTSCSSEEKEPAVFEQEEINKTPQHISTSPFLDQQTFESDCESLAASPLKQKVVMSSEDKESMVYCSPQEQNILFVQGTMKSGSVSELSNPSPTECSLMQDMFTSSSNKDINFLPIPSVMPVPRLTSTSPVSRKTSSTHASTGKSSPELLNLCPTQFRNTSEIPDLEDTYCATLSVSTLPTNDNVEIDPLTVSDISNETRGLVYSSIDGRERLESPAINKTCSSPHHSASAHLPEQVMIHSPVGYTISPSPTNERTGSSTEPEDSPSFPVVTRIEYRDICSSPDHSEPVIIQPTPCYNISPSPTNERWVYSTEPHASTSSPCGHSDIQSSPDHSIPAHSPEPEIIHSPVGYTITPSPTNKIMIFSVEPNDLPSSPAITGTDYTATLTCSRDSTPALRSITSTPNSRENYLTPEPNSPAPSLELRSVTCSPQIKTISYSVLTQNTKSPGITYNVTPTEDLAQSPAVETNVCGNSSETSSYLFGNDTSVLPSSRNFLLTPESRSRPSSATSEHTKHTTLSSDLQPEPAITLEKAENLSLSIICDGVSHPFSNPIDHFDDDVDSKTLKSLSFVPDECKGSGPPVQTLQDSTSKTSYSGLSTVKIEKSQENVTENTTDLTSLCPLDVSLPKPVASVENKQCHVEVFDRNKGTEMLKNDSPSSDKRLSHVPVALRESPGVISKDNGGEFDRQPCREKEESGKKEGEGEETIGESSYRGEQVELSFSAKNRKGPAGHSPALSSRDPKSGIPARCYFESHPTTLQQQCQLRAQGSQQENKVGARKLQSAAQGKYSSEGFLPPEYTGETSSMGSEFDEADNEVMWFTDLAFRSLSSPQVDYLDVYNSSHRSSTNVSQPSTVDSPGAVAWMTYADLRGSALHENDGSSFLPHDSLYPNKRFEMGSFECVDVALESKEESSRGKRTVPKRQIQLLRRNTDESKHKGNNENIMNSPSTYRRSKDSLVRQHSTPAIVQEEVSKEVPNSPQNDMKKTLQKSVSLDDGSPKTQMASCIIKSVLSKKMQDVQKETPKSTDPSPSGDKNKHPDVSPSSFDGVLSTMEKHSLSSSQHSECTLSSEDFAVGEKRVSHHQPKKCAPKVPPKPFLRPAFFNNGEAQIAGIIAREETKPIVALPQVDDKIQNSKSDRKEGGGSNLEEKYNNDSANASISNTSPVVATPAISMQNRMTTRDIRKRQMTPENQEQLAGKSVFMSKTPEITLKPSSIKGKKTSSLKVSLSPDLEQSREISKSQAIEKAAEDISINSTKLIETEDDDDSNKKSVIHRVRDVRKLVKNTYNLSFKASNSTSTAEETVIQGEREKPPQTPPALYIECKAISWKDKQTSGSKAMHCHDEKLPVDISKISQPWVSAETKRDVDITEITSKGSSPKTESKEKTPYSHSTTTDALSESESINKRSYVHCDQSSKMPPRPPGKEREVSALVVLPDSTSNTKTVSPTILDSTQTKAASNSHSVSMLLKEKGMQADIGVCDVLTEGKSATAKHVNRLEVPLQACLSESISSEVQVNEENKSLPCNPTAFVNDSSRTSQPSESPKGTLTEEPSKEQEKKKTATTTITQIPTYLATCGKPEVRSFSSITKNNATPVSASKEIELPIQVRSISTDRLKPFVPPKPSYKQSFAEIKSAPSDPSKADTQPWSVIKQQTISSSESKKNETPSTVTHKDQRNETSSRDTKRLAVSAVSSCKPPSIPVTTTPSFVQKSTTKTLASLDQQQSSAFLQTTSTCQLQTPSFSQDQSILDSSFASNSPGPQALNHKPSVTRASSNNRFHTDDNLFYASDDPPSYDERESFSPLQLSDLPPHRSCRYHPTTKQCSCSCMPSSHSHQGHPNNSPQERVPAASRSPGQVLTCPGGPPQAQVRPHQCRPDGLPVSNTTIPHASALIQPLQHPQACPVSNSQSYGDDHPPVSGLHADRRPANHPSPQAAGPAPYHEYSHSANMSTLDPRPQLFNPQDLTPSFGHDYANEGPGGAGVLYPENASGLSCGQGPRRVLLDPETGKYFYIEVPMQPLRKMLFDPELGQYVEVLIPHQAMSHSGLYPPAAPPYSSLHSPGLYAPQYLPYAVPSYPAISGTAPQVRHPEPPPVPTTLHQTSLRYGSPASQMPKNEPKGHSSLDQSYLESMYYIPTGMNASPNATPSECYHKPSSMPPSGGRRA
ncbi:mucin-3A [Carassius carassius]|uniref:mucin-3A n=1 Tax=Carassius carassius TaxID=217509 RepID=UPI002868DC52|nr:mucin-3A [Carassius carassius]